MVVATELIYGKAMKSGDVILLGEDTSTVVRYSTHTLGLFLALYTTDLMGLPISL